MDTILVAGAQGECPAQLIALLEAAGYPLRSSGRAEDVLTPEAMGLVMEAQQQLGVSEPEELNVELNDGTPVVIKGALVGQATWDALRARAADRTGLLVSPPESSPGAGANASSGSPSDTSSPPAADASALEQGDGAQEQPPEGVFPGEAAAAAEAAAREQSE